jgi:hypothetical protein
MEYTVGSLAARPNTTPYQWRWVLWGLALLVLLGLLVGAVLLQRQILSQQAIDIGSRLDSGRHYRLYGSEQSDALPGANGPVAANYRWARARSSIFLGPLLPHTPHRLALTLLGPTEGATVTLTANTRPLATLPLDTRLRRYQLLVPPDRVGSGDLALGLDGVPSQLNNDPRRAVALVDAVAVRALPDAAIGRVFFAAPYLPLGVAVLFLAALLLRAPTPLALGVATLSLLGVAALARSEPLAARTACLLLLAAGVLSVGSTLAVAGLRRLPRLWPRTRRSALAWIAGGFLVALLLFFTPRIASDGVLYYVYLRSLAIDGDWDFANEFSDESTLQHVLEVEDNERTETGYFANAASVGPAIIWSPFFALAHGIVLIGGALGLPWQPNGYAQPYIVLVSFASALGTLVTMLGCYHICRRFVGSGVATLAALTAFFGSNLLFYGLVESSFAHALSTMAATLLVLAWLRLEEQPTTARWALVGLAGGATVLLYWITALLLVMPLLSGLRLLLRAGQRRDWAGTARLVGQGSLAAGLALLVVMPQLLTWQLIYGAPLAAPHGTDYITPQSFNLMDVLFSSLYGLLPWTPAFFVGLVGLALLPRRHPWLGLCMLAACLLYIGYNASLSRWFAGGSFGMRRLTACAPFFALGLALLFERLARVRLALPVVLASLLVAWSIAVLVRYQGYMLSHTAYSLKFLPKVQFYFDRNALPLWALPDLIGNSYPLGLLRGLARPEGWLYFGLMGGALGLCFGAVLWGYWRVAARLQR